jgi:hypothetical protein
MGQREWWQESLYTWQQYELNETFIHPLCHRRWSHFPGQSSAASYAMRLTSCQVTLPCQPSSPGPARKGNNIMILDPNKTHTHHYALRPININCWVLHPVARVSTNAFLKTTVRNNVSVLDFIVHYLLHVSALIGGHLQVKCTQNILRWPTMYVNGSVESAV